MKPGDTVYFYALGGSPKEIRFAKLVRFSADFQGAYLLVNHTFLYHAWREVKDLTRVWWFDKIQEFLE